MQSSKTLISTVRFKVTSHINHLLSARLIFPYISIVHRCDKSIAFLFYFVTILPACCFVFRLPPFSKTLMKRILFAAPYWHEELMQSIARHAAGHGWHLNLETALSGVFPQGWQGDGILTTISDDIAAFEHCWRQAKCPAVSLSLNHPELDIPRVGIANDPAGRLAAEHLLERGFRSFAFYDRRGQHAGELRYRAFAAALESTGHTVSHWVAQPDSQAKVPWIGRQRFLESELRQIEKPCGIFASDDFAGVEVIEACQSLGLDIPHDIGVLGMLDIPLFRQSTTIALSSITVNFDEHTRIACDLLDRLMHGQAPPDEPILIAPTGLAVRRSTDVIAAKTPGVAKAVRYMMQHYAQTLDVPKIVEASGMSQTRLYEAFREDVGQAPAAVLTRIRLEKAKRQLKDTSATLEVVSANCGFGDRINLYRLFKQHVGMSPGQYRKQVRTSRHENHPRHAEG